MAAAVARPVEEPNAVYVAGTFALVLSGAALVGHLVLGPYPPVIPLLALILASLASFAITVAHAVHVRRKMIWDEEPMQHETKVRRARRL